MSLVGTGRFDRISAYTPEDFRLLENLFLFFKKSVTKRENTPTCAQADDSGATASHGHEKNRRSTDHRNPVNRTSSGTAVEWMYCRWPFVQRGLVHLAGWRAWIAVACLAGIVLAAAEMTGWSRDWFSFEF